MSETPLNPLVVMEGVRTPFGKMGGSLATYRPEELARQTAREVLDRSGIDTSTLDEVIYGCVGQDSKAANIARVIALKSGVPETVPAYTVHRNCASGMEAITQASTQLAAGRGALFLVGGTESMSQYPLVFNKRAVNWFSRLNRSRGLGQKLGALLGFRPAMLAPRITLLEGLKDPVCGLNMGQTAENIVRDFGLTREEQDAFALESHLKAVASREFLDGEILPVIGANGPVLTQDENVREEQSMEALQKLRCVFEKKHGTVTAGNACPVTDGAVSLLVGSEEAASAVANDPLGRVLDFVHVGLDPSRMGLGPIHAIKALLDRSGLLLSDIDLFEINEAFAGQVLGCLAAAQSSEFARQNWGTDQPLGQIPVENLNVNGGAIALGHPVGATGARLVLTLLRELKTRGKKRGIASLCVGGGQGTALLLEV